MVWEADFDGDTISLRGIWSDEANDEAEKIMNTKMSALNITGTNAKVVAKEVFNSMYELTKIGPSPKPIQQKDVDNLLSMQPNDITRTFLADNIGDITSAKGMKHKARYNTWDTMTVPAKYFFEDQKEFQTTLGRFIFNKFILQSSGIIAATGYYDAVVNKKILGDLDDLVASLYMKDAIQRSQFNSYIDHRDTLGYWLNGMLAHTISERMLKPLPQVEKRKKELCKKYEKEIASGDVDVMTKISDELVAYAKELLKDDPGMDLYASGDLDFGNNYKNNSIIKGAVKNEITDEFDFIETSFMDGMQIKDLPAHANSILASQFPASIATAEAGYEGKKLMALLQMVEIDEPGTDCGTKNLIPITITPYNKKFMTHTYITDGGQERLLTEENIGSYVGKTVKMRSPMTCINHKICAKCAGTLFHMLNIEHAGLFATAISHSALNLALKSKHVSNISLSTLNPDTLLMDL